MDSSRAVMGRRLDTLMTWLMGDSPLFQTFHKQVDAGREPQDNEWDQGREAAESAVNPFVFRQLNFAALSLDGEGVVSYGPFSLTLKDATIEDRASVFEENPFYFNKRHRILAGGQPPKGYRAAWPDRGKLAVAKLHGKVTSTTVGADFPHILMEDRRTEDDCDFIEVHIYGAVNRQSIDRVVGTEPTVKADRLIWLSLKQRLQSLGAVVDVN